MGIAPSSYWANVHKTQDVDEWCMKYWMAYGQEHRSLLVNAVHEFSPVTSIAEIGCAVGTNLMLLEKGFPYAKLTGYDINEEALAFGRARLPEVNFVKADMLELDPEPADVIVSCYSLAYVPPDHLSRVMSKLINAARLGIVLAEPMTVAKVGGHFINPSLEGFEEWVHNYSSLLPGRSDIFIIDPPVNRLNGILLWKKQ